ncbi:hypothetical protein HD806DRAFT_507983 [Xylariaceae sp. AK1471]|nr:hypothetical protein HD806DRAFT_507983 [Xylariaceae sp. AK1471]
MAWFPFIPKLQKFEYPSLCSKPRTFRVIKLLPSTRSLFPPFRETLNIEIIEISVDDVADKYDTLSYCWGSGAADRRILISLPDNNNGGKRRILYISASLEQALLSLARERNTEPIRPIFADQICINQANNAEKIQQLRMMGNIYARSTRAIVWLGDETPETCRYFNFSTELNSEGIMGRVMGPNVATVMNVFDAVMDSSKKLETAAEQEDREDILDLIARYGPRFPVHGMAEIFRRTWISRLWTVQEGCLPPHLTFRCGEKSLCVECLRGTMLFYSICTTYWVVNSNASVPQNEVHMRNEIYTLNQPFMRLVQERRRIHSTQDPRGSLYDTVIKYNVNDDAIKAGATKAEDRIYALLGLANADKDNIAKETEEGMEVDNVRGTYTKFATSVIKTNVDVLLFSQIPKSLAHGHQLPSWVPDWSTEHLRTPYGYSDLTTPVFSTGGQASHDIVVDISTGALRVDAILVGRVTRVGVHSMQRDESSRARNVEFISVRRFFEEIEEFIETATKVNPINAPNISDNQQRLESMIRISDGGLSLQQFSTKFDPTTSQALLPEIHRSVSTFGKFLMDVEDRTRLMSSFTGMIHSVGIMPWYWTPASEIDVIRLCAINPIAAARIWIEGFYLAISDVVMVKWHSTKVRLYSAFKRSTFSRLRRERQKVDLGRKPDEKILSNVGLTNDIVHTQEWDHYTSNLLKNIGRKLFLTDTGYVGLGPYQMEVGDAIVVIPGGSVPHVLRQKGASYLTDPGYSSQTMPCSYIGEAYCDGIMDGKLVNGERIATMSFEIL